MDPNPLLNFYQTSRAANKTKTNDTSCRPEKLCKTTKQYQEWAHINLNLSMETPVVGEEMEGTQSWTRGSYIYDVESCNIRTITIHLVKRTSIGC